jgi:hypothetical protein
MPVGHAGIHLEQPERAGLKYDSRFLCADGVLGGRPVIDGNRYRPGRDLSLSGGPNLLVPRISEKRLNNQAVWPVIWRFTGPIRAASQLIDFESGSRPAGIMIGQSSALSGSNRSFPTSLLGTQTRSANYSRSSGDSASETSTFEETELPGSESSGVAKNPTLREPRLRRE